MSHSVVARYYLAFDESSGPFLDQVQAFFSLATLGTTEIVPQLTAQSQTLLRGSIIELTPDEENRFGGHVTYEFHPDSFAYGDISSLLGTLLYPSVMRSLVQLRLMGITLPSSLLNQFAGPKLGLVGILAGNAPHTSASASKPRVIPFSITPQFKDPTSTWASMSRSRRICAGRP